MSRRWVKWLLVSVLAVVCTLALQMWRAAHPFAFSLGSPLPERKIRPQLLVSGEAAVLLAPNGTLWAWGKDSGLPNGRSDVPLRLGHATDWIDIAGSWGFMLARKADGSLWSWRRSAAVAEPRDGEILFAPTRVGSDSDWWLVATTGFGGAYAVQRSGAVWAWGRYDNDTDFIPTPTRFGTEPGAVAIRADTVSRYVLRRDGTIWSRDPRHGRGGAISMQLTQLGIDHDWVAISAHGQLLALKADGSLWSGSGAATFNAVPEGSRLPAGRFAQIGPDRDWSEIHDGWNCFLARKRDGSWWADGENLHGRLGFAPYGANWGIELEKLPFTFDPWALGIGGTTTLMLARDGSLWTWGKRLGAKPPSARSTTFGNSVNRLSERFPLRPKPIPDPGATWNHRPLKIWQWKPDTR